VSAGKHLRHRHNNRQTACTHAMPIAILMYHQIDIPPARGTPLRGLVVHPGDFNTQMRWLKWAGYQGLSMRDLEPYLAGKKQGRVFGITLDDGYKNNFDNALPALLRHGFTATCYGVSSQIGGTNAWDSGLVAEKPLMGLREWAGWLQSGMEIGGHTRTHADLTRLSAAAAEEEIGGCKTDFERALDCEIRHFATHTGATHRRTSAWQLLGLPHRDDNPPRQGAGQGQCNGTTPCDGRTGHVFVAVVRENRDGV